MATSSGDCEQHWTNTQYCSSSSGGGAVGERDVMIIAPRCCCCDTPHRADTVARLPGSRLTLGESEKLTNQGIARELQGDDLSIMRARFSLDARCTVVAVESGGELCKTRILEQIEALLQHTEKNGVILYYMGPGRRHTGDWCFKDGFITFAELFSLYTQHFRGRVLTLVTDCSHAGGWVREAIAFLDEEGARPCGHWARDSGMLLKVYASCQRDEAASCTRFSIKGVENDKNTGRLTFLAGLRGRQVGASQHVSGVDFTMLRCGARSIKEECLMLHTTGTWSQWAARSRVRLLLGADIKGPVWQYVLLDSDDRETEKRFREDIAAGCVDHVSQYGMVLRAGSGEQPTNDVREWMERRYNYR